MSDPPGLNKLTVLDSATLRRRADLSRSQARMCAANGDDARAAECLDDAAECHRVLARRAALGTGR